MFRSSSSSSTGSRPSPLFLGVHVVFVGWVLLLSTCSSTTSAETVLLAACPQEPDVEGIFRNNGQYCVRDRLVLSREVIDATCPEDYHFQGNNKCRKNKSKSSNSKEKGNTRGAAAAASRSVNPTCPPNYQRYANKCHKRCPTKEYRTTYSDCILPRQTLGPKYMTCPSTIRAIRTTTSDDTTEHPQQEQYHRYDAYCCIPGVNCPQLQCNVGPQVPGKFFYNTQDGTCERQVATLQRPVTARKTNEECVPPLVQVWGVCQEPCPYGYQPLKGKCELRPCTFDPKNDEFVECPEATYKVSQSIL